MYYKINRRCNNNVYVLTRKVRSRYIQRRKADVHKEKARKREREREREREGVRQGVRDHMRE